MDTLRLPAELDSLEQFRAFVNRKAEECGLGPELLLKIELVLEEILTNQVRHAYKETKGEAEVRCRTRGDGGFCLELADWGPPFNPLEQAPPDTDLPLEERGIGGLGIHLVRNMSDHLEYRREGGQNILTVCFQKG